MFGIYRTLLALFVVASHLMSITVIGQYAVHGFFILSGYLMTHIMTRSYGYDPKGVRAFCINRFLRLYPSYWVLCVIITPILYLAGTANTLAYNYNMGIPHDALTWLQNLGMFYADMIPMRVNPRFSPPTWALTVEIVFYALIALGLSKTCRRSLVWFCLSVAYMAATHVLHLENNFRYAAWMAGSLPFASGAVLYHTMDRLKPRLAWLRTRMGMLALTSVFMLNCLGGCLVVLLGLKEGLGHGFYYLNLVLNFALVFAMAEGMPFPVSRKFDATVGDYSYPVYLFHFPAGLAASMLLFDEPRRGFHLDGVLVMCGALPLCFAVSYAVIRFVDHPIQRIRTSLKQHLKPEYGGRHGLPGAVRNQSLETNLESPS
jgi:peptidoglycan/LPS O-acetylase OafA/YrhL